VEHSTSTPRLVAGSTLSVESPCSPIRVVPKCTVSCSNGWIPTRSLQMLCAALAVLRTWSKLAPTRTRLYVLPTLIRSDIYPGRSVVAEGRARDYLALVEQHPNPSAIPASLFEANMYVGKLAHHRGDRKTAVQHLLAAVTRPVLPNSVSCRSI
jgi:hypothetical protein